MSGINFQTLELIDLPSFAIHRMTTRDSGCGLSCPDRRGRWHGLIPAGFLGLIVAIVLWGTAYKLSLYHPHPAPTMRTQVAKLWVETRVSYVVSLRQVKGLPDVATHLHALAVQSRPPAGLIGVPGAPFEVPSKDTRTALGPIPSRSPPSLSLCLG